MEIFSNWTNITRLIALMGVAQGGILFTITFRNRKFKSNLYISWLILILTTIILHAALIDKNNILDFPVFWFLEFRFYLIGPLLFFYIRATLFEPEKKWIPFGYHAIPAFIAQAFMLFMYITLDPETRSRDTLEAFNGSSPLYMSVMDFFRLSSGLAYSVPIFLSLRRFEHLNLKSNRHKTPQNWLKVLFAMHLALWSLGWVTFLIHEEGVSQRDISGIPFAISVICYGLAMYAGFYFSQKYPTLFGTEENRNKARENFKFDTDELNRMVQSITSYLDNEKPFLDEFFSLKDLAQGTNLHPNTLSFVINEKFQKNFRELINDYRVDHFLEYLRSAPDGNLLHQAFEAGFSSKSSFNKSFKLRMQQTPSEYRDKLRKELASSNAICNDTGS